MTQAQKTDLRETIARLLLYRAYQESLETGLLDDFITKYHERFLAHADAVLAIARPAIIEECAKVAELHGDGLITRSVLDSIVAAIRNLAEKP